MAHNRAERRYKTALIKRKLERIVQQELAAETHHCWMTERGYRPCLRIGREEPAIRRFRFKNEGRQGCICWECGPHACDWCLRGFYRKHIQRALENDLREYLRGG